MSLSIFKHLLPSGRAWKLTKGKKITKFFEALDRAIILPVVLYSDLIFQDVFPETTRNLDDWEKQFALPSSGLNDAERRSRLAAWWKAKGGQSPKYIQDTLRNAGFDVYVHEWWETRPEPGDHSPATARNPFSVLNPTYAGTLPGVDCGEPEALCGEEWALCGNYTEKPGYPLVNKLIYDAPAMVYTVPSDPDFWPYFLYIGGKDFGDVATIPATRRYEFEALILKIRPAQQWIGVIARFT